MNTGLFMTLVFYRKEGDLLNERNICHYCINCPSIKDFQILTIMIFYHWESCINNAGKRGSGEVGKWGSGEVGKWGSGEA